MMLEVGVMYPGLPACQEIMVRVLRLSSRDRLPLRQSVRLTVPAGR